MTEAEAKVKAEALYDELDQGEFDENVPVAELRAWAVGKMAASILAASRPGEDEDRCRECGRRCPNAMCARCQAASAAKGVGDE